MKRARAAFSLKRIRLEFLMHWGKKHGNMTIAT